ncbi:MAG TPA: flagellin [Bryobacteraceae bacterium]|jgi:flagellin|nr:flagellin [Bryobacteraceae bacterium]
MLPLSLQTNVTSLFAQQQLEQNDNFESNTIQQLTSGFRINEAGNDAAGLAVANQLQANVAELQQGVINAANGTSTLQIIDGGLSNISNLLDRLQTLATESASGTFEGSRTTLNNEFTSVLDEITRQAGNIGLASGGTTSNTGTIGSSQYNTTALAVFIGGGDTGVATDNQVTVDLTNGGTGGVTVTGVDATGLGINAADVSTAADASTALGLVQAAIASLGTVQGAVGAGENLLNYATSLANSQITNLTASESSIKDANIAQQASNLAKAQTLQQSSIAALAQANSMPEAILKLLQ